MDSRSGVVIRGLLKFSKALYFIVCGMYIFFLTTNIFQFFHSEDSSKYIIKFFDNILGFTQSVIGFLIFLYSLKIFDQYASNTQTFRSFLKKVAQLLIFISIVDAIRILYLYIFKIDFKKPSPEFYESDHWLAPPMKFIGNNIENLNAFSDYITICPSGLGAVFAGLLIFHYLNRKK